MGNFFSFDTQYNVKLIQLLLNLLDMGGGPESPPPKGLKMLNFDVVMTPTILRVVDYEF